MSTFTQPFVNVHVHIYVVGLSTGAIVGIVIGSLMIMVLIVIGVTVIVLRKSTKRLVNITNMPHCDSPYMYFHTIYLFIDTAPKPCIQNSRSSRHMTVCYGAKKHYFHNWIVPD